MVFPTFLRERKKKKKLTEVSGNGGIFFSRWRLTFQRGREKRRVQSGQGRTERRGESVRELAQRVVVDAAVCGARRPEGGGHGRGGLALSYEGVQKVPSVCGVQALSGGETSSTRVTGSSPPAGATCERGENCSHRCT